MKIQAGRNWVAALAALFVACGGGNETAPAPAAPTEPRTRPAPVRLPTLVAERCSIQPTEATDAKFSEAEAQKSLVSARAMAADCQPQGTKQPAVEILWGPSGCVRSVKLLSPVSDAGVESCLLHAFEAAGVPPFSGSAAQVLNKPDGRHDEFSRIGVLAHSEIEKVVSTYTDKFRKCYIEGFRRNPALRGKVGVRFVIPENGTVMKVSDAGSDLPDAEVVACVLQTFVGMRFPPPTGGSVTAVYPVLLEPGI